MTGTIYEQVQGEVLSRRDEVEPTLDAGSPPVDPPDEKTYGGGDHEPEEPVPVPEGVNVVLDARRIYAGLAAMCQDDSVQYDHFAESPVPNVVKAFLDGYNAYDENDPVWQEQDWQGI